MMAHSNYHMPYVDGVMPPFFFACRQEGMWYGLNSTADETVNSGELLAWLRGFDERIELETYQNKRGELMYSACICFPNIPLKRMTSSRLKPYVSKHRRAKSGGYFVTETKLYLPLVSSVIMANMLQDLKVGLNMLDEVETVMAHVKLMESRRTACAVEVEGKVGAKLPTEQLGRYTAGYLQYDAEVSRSDKEAKQLLNAAVRKISQVYADWEEFCKI